MTKCISCSCPVCVDCEEWAGHDKPFPNLCPNCFDELTKTEVPTMKTKPTAAQFQALCTQLGDDAYMAELLQVNQSTIYRWRMGLRPVPYSVCELLRYKIKDLDDDAAQANLNLTLTMLEWDNGPS